MKSRFLSLPFAAALLVVSCAEPEGPVLPPLPAAGHFVASDEYREGFLAGRDDRRTGQKSRLAAHLHAQQQPGPNPREEDAAGPSDYEAGHAAGFASTPGERRSWFETGHLIGEADAQAGLRPQPSRHWEVAGEAERPEFTRGYALGWNSARND